MKTAEELFNQFEIDMDFPTLKREILALYRKGITSPIDTDKLRDDKWLNVIYYLAVRHI